MIAAIPSFHLEIDVLVLGIVILLVETFATKIDKKVFAYVGIIGLTLVLIASFFISTNPAEQTGPLWNFYTADRLAIFFKRFELITTIVVLVMMIDYAPAMRRGDDQIASTRRLSAAEKLSTSG